jgi:hypothetical protein
VAVEEKGIQGYRGTYIHVPGLALQVYCKW